MTHWKRPWCWERLKAGGEGDNRGWDGGWHHQLDGHECEQAPGVGDGQGSLASCSPWGRKFEHDWVTEQQREFLVYARSETIRSEIGKCFLQRAKQKIFQAGHRVSVKTAALAGGKQAQTNVNDWAWLCANKASWMDIEPRVSYDFQVLWNTFLLLIFFPQAPKTYKLSVRFELTSPVNHRPASSGSGDGVWKRPLQPPWTSQQPSPEQASKTTECSISIFSNTELQAFKNLCTTPCACPSRLLPSPNNSWIHLFPPGMSLSVQPPESLCWAQTIRVANSDLWPPPATSQVLFPTFGHWAEVSNYISGMLCTPRLDLWGSLSLDWSSLLHVQITNLYLPSQTSSTTGCSGRPPGPTSISPWTRAGGSACSLRPHPMRSSEQLEGLWKNINQIKLLLCLKPSYDFLLNLKWWHPRPTIASEASWDPTSAHPSDAISITLLRLLHSRLKPTTCAPAIGPCTRLPLPEPWQHWHWVYLPPGSRTSTERLPGALSPVLGIGWWERETVLLFSSIWHSNRSRQRGNKKYTSKTDLSSAT